MLPTLAGERLRDLVQFTYKANTYSCLQCRDLHWGLSRFSYI